MSEIPYSCPNPEEFHNILIGLFPHVSGNDSSLNMALMKECQEKINYMLQRELCDLFGCCSASIQQPNATKTVIFNALVVLKHALTPSSVSLNDVRKDWFSPRFSEARKITQDSIVYCLASEFEEIRNEAAHCFTFLLCIESQEWPIIPFLINKLISNETSNYFKSGIVTTFREIFSSPLFFNGKVNNIEEIFSGLYNFFQFLLTQIITPGLDQDKYIECSLCLRLMLDRIPDFFGKGDELKKNIEFILNALEIAFPHASKLIYRNFHHIILQIFKNYYKYPEFFMDRIFDFLIKGLSSEYKKISIDFWHSVYKFEKNIYEIKEGYNENFITDYFHFTTIISKTLTKPFLQILLELKDPTNENFISNDYDDWVPFCCRVLSNFVKAALLRKDIENNPVIDNCIEFIEFCINQSEQTIYSILGGLNALKIICQKNHIPIFDSIFIHYFPFIIENCRHQVQRISVTALLLLRRFIRKQKYTSSQFAPLIFQVAIDLIPSHDDIRIENVMKVISDFCYSLDKFKILTYFTDFKNIFQNSISDKYIFDSEFVAKPYLILYNYFNSLKKSNYSPSDKYEQEKYFSLLNETKSSAKKLLDQALIDLYNSFDLMLYNRQLLQSGIFSLIRSLIYFLDIEATNYINKTVELMIKILNHQRDYIEDVFLVLYSVFDTNIGTIDNYINPMLNAVEIGFSSKNPIIIGETSLFVGLLFRKLKEHIFQYPFESLIEYLFSLFIDPSVDNTRDYYAKVIDSISYSFEAIGTKFPVDSRDAYAKKLIELSKSPININNYSDVYEMQQVFSAVARGFTILFAVYAPNSDNKDVEFLKMFKIKNKKQNLVCDFLRRVYKDRLFVKDRGIDKKLISNCIDLIIQFILSTEHEFNSCIHNSAIKHLVEIGKANEIKNAMIAQSKIKNC